MENLDKNLVISEKQAVFRNDLYQSICQRFIFWCQDQSIPEIMENEILWLESLKDEGLSAATIRLYAYAIKGYLLDNLDVTDMTPSDKVLAEYQIESCFRSYRLPRIANKKHKVRVINHDELILILKRCRVKTRIIIEFLACTGCRVSEMRMIRLSHVRKVRSSEYKIRVLGKGRKERIVRINSGLRKRISKAFPNTQIYLFESSPGQFYSRQGVYDLVKRAGERVDIYGLHPHSLRHYFITTRLKETWKLNALSKYVGHSDPSTTLVYLNDDDLSLDELSLDIYGRRGKKGETNAKKSS